MPPSSVLGCVVPIAINYDSSANVHDKSCRYHIPGCMDPTADNYLPSANVPGSVACKFKVSGCTDQNALNFNSLANVNEGCTYNIPGCMVPTAPNYASTATLNDGSCIVLGCMDSAKYGYNPAATMDDSSCLAYVAACTDSAAANYIAAQPIILSEPSMCVFPGCTDALAANYDQTANTDDGACSYLKASFNVAFFGYVKDCSAFVDENGNQILDAGENSAVTDDGGFASISYRTFGSIVQAGPGTAQELCQDAVTGNRLQVPLLTDAAARMATPLTSVATFIKSINSVSSAAASSSLWSAFGLSQQSVWDFDPLKAATVSSFSLADTRWLIRAQQVLNIPAFLQPLFTSGTNAATVASFQALASMITSDGSVTLTDVNNISRIITLTGAILNQPYNAGAAQTAASNCATANTNFESQVAASSISRRRLSHPRSRSLQSSGFLCMFANSSTPCVTGCTNPIASNYDSTATVDDTSCTYMGCTNSTASNFNVAANTDDNTCIFPQPGCTTVGAINYDSTAIPNSAPCVHPVDGCTNSNAVNFFSSANIDDGSCVLPVYGCTAPAALNYASFATVNDGSCKSLISGCVNSDADNYNAAADSDDGSCVISGCTNSLAHNYLSVATLDSSDCDTPSGCTSPVADNYNSQAVIDDGSCVRIGCTDPKANNYDNAANQAGIICVYPFPSPPPAPPPPSPPVPSFPPPAFPPRSTSSGGVASVQLLAQDSAIWPQPIAANEALGAAVAGVGDLNGDGVADIAIGAQGSAEAAGRFYVMLLNSDGSAKSASLSNPAGLKSFDYFGSALASASDQYVDPATSSQANEGDLDGDGVSDIAVGAYGDDGDAGAQTGAVYLMYLNSDGSSKTSFIKICNSSSSASAVISMHLEAGAQFGRSVAMLGTDSSKQNAVTLAVGAPGEAAGRGSVHIVSLRLSARTSAGRRLQAASQATLISAYRLNIPTAPSGEGFGTSVAWMPDRDQDDFPDLAVGAPNYAGGGAVYVVGAKSGNVLQIVQAADPYRADGARFGHALSLGFDYDGNTLPELVVGAPGEGTGGAVHLIFMPDAKDVRITPVDLGYSDSGRRLQADTSSTAVPIGDSIAVAGRIDDDLVPDLVIGAPRFGSTKTGGVVNVILQAAIAPPSPPGFSASDSQAQKTESGPGYGGGGGATTGNGTSTSGPVSIPSFTVGGIVGIVVGILVFFFCLAFFCFRKYRKPRLARYPSVNQILTAQANQRPDDADGHDGEEDDDDDEGEDGEQEAAAEDVVLETVEAGDVLAPPSRHMTM